MWIGARRTARLRPALRNEPLGASEGIETKNMKFHEIALCACAFLVVADLCAAQTPAPASPNPAPAKSPNAYVRTKEGGAKLKNLADAKGETVLDAPAGALMAVYSERAGWLEVEPASGMKVWIHGSFLKPTKTQGILEVTANSVRMRPLPASDEKSFPLPMKLDKGERVRAIARADSNKRLEDDWVQVWSPAGARAFIAASDTVPLPAGEDAHKAWGAAVLAAQSATPGVEVAGASAAEKNAAPGEKGEKVATAEAAAKKEPRSKAAVDKLAEAEKLMTAARASENPDFGAAKSAYHAVIEESPSGASAGTAQARLDEIAIREEIQRLKLEKSSYEKQRTEKLADAESKLREINRRQDPLWGRLQARGWLESEVKPGALPRYMLRWGGKDVAEIQCASGRYDLQKFVGFEVGVIGVTQRAAVEGTADLPGTPAQIDATRLEVISARGGV